jgi:hypothetical protein
MALGRAGANYAERVVPQVMERGGLPAEMLSAMAQGTQSPATVFHGSPHRFTKFDSSKIGTGEGAQVYGHGLYLAESPDVADQYKKTLAHKAFAKIEQVDRNNYKVTAPDGTVVSEGLPLGPATRVKDAFNANAGNLYQVDLPDEQIAKMLDYDKPLNKQAKPVREALSKLGITVDDTKLGEYEDALLGALMSDAPTGPLPRQPVNMTGGEILKELQRNPSRYLPQVMQGRELTQAMINPAQGASSVLRQAGIPGIRYLDQGSRVTPNITNKRLADLFQKHGGNAEAAVDEMMRSVYNSPKKKAEMREQFMKQLQTQTPKTSNFVVFPGMEDMLRIDKINEQPISQGLIGQF